MNFNNFTIKSQEAVQEAVNLTQSRRAGTHTCGRTEGGRKRDQLHIPEAWNKRPAGSYSS